MTKDDMRNNKDEIDIWFHVSAINYGWILQNYFIKGLKNSKAF